jgi:hypothetical protein
MVDCASCLQGLNALLMYWNICGDHYSLNMTAKKFQRGGTDALITTAGQVRVSQ